MAAALAILYAAPGINYVDPWAGCMSEGHTYVRKRYTQAGTSSLHVHIPCPMTTVPPSKTGAHLMHPAVGWVPCRSGSLGPLAHEIFVDQFTRLRDGDFYWYERSGVLEFDVRAEVRSTKLVSPLSLAQESGHRTSFLLIEPPSQALLNAHVFLPIDD